ncbi:Arginine--tRNA ligase [bioreactor metagenome]|uniref:arginine--tRNA ligase n=1 Tax=bioreactor metagenome TaxID=1076179 RepID=A0A644UAD3_9ZZZZ|nr:arginine--tRNA ligase [Candidatus Elulimicrobiales bacterium]
MTLLENIKKELEKTIISLVLIKEGDLLNFDVSFIEEVNSKFGDVSTNLAMILSKESGEDTKNIASKIKENLEKNEDFLKIVKEIEIAQNGFINFFLKEEFLVEEIARVASLDFINTKFTDKKVLVEHSSPNLFKPFHVGHLMNNIIGDSLVKMMKASKADLRVMSFPSDISIGIAKAIFILKNKEGWSFFNEDIIKTLGEAYAEGVRFYEENIPRREEIKKIARNLFERNEETEDYRIYSKAREVNIEYFERIVGILGTKFDNLIYESEAGLRGEEIVKSHVNKEAGKEIFEIGEEGAIVFDTKRRKNKETEETIKSVFINSEGYPTYEAKDLGLLDLKYRYFPFDYNFFVTDNEQVPHFETVLEAAKELSGDWEKIVERSKHVPHGRLNLKGERMSSRLGNVPTVEEVLETVNKKAKERISEKTSDISEKEKESLIKNISLSALKIAILKSRPGLNIDFDFETSFSFDGATGPYLLYTYARANSLLEKVENVEESKIVISENNFPLVKKIIQFEAVSKKGIEELAPQSIVKYLFELSQAFNTFYAKEKIITEDKETTDSNISLVKDFVKVFKFALNMIGIEEVSRM